MFWTRRPKPRNPIGVAEASAAMVNAIATGRGRGMAWIDYLAASAAEEAAARAARNPRLRRRLQKIQRQEESPCPCP